MAASINTLRLCEVINHLGNQLKLRLRSASESFPRTCRFTSAILLTLALSYIPSLNAFFLAGFIFVIGPMTIYKLEIIASKC